MFNALANVNRMFRTHPLTKEQILRTWVRFFVWRIVSTINKEIYFKWVGGNTLIVSRGMTGATGNIYCGLHEFVDMLFVMHFLRPGDVFADVGANIGSYTVLSAGVAKANTYSFEPDPTTIKSLIRNISVNDLDRRVKCYQAALGMDRGKLRFTVGQDTTNRAAQPGDTEAQEVEQIRLDDVHFMNTPALIKIDAEGYDGNVISGGTTVLSDKSLKALLIENVEKKTGILLEEFGFQRIYYDPYSRELTDTVQENLYLNNYLYVRDTHYINERVKAAQAICVRGVLI